MIRLYTDFVPINMLSLFGFATYRMVFACVINKFFPNFLMLLLILFYRVSLGWSVS